MRCHYCVLYRRVKISMVTYHCSACKRNSCAHVVAGSTGARVGEEGGPRARGQLARAQGLAPSPAPVPTSVGAPAPPPSRPHAHGPSPRARAARTDTGCSHTRSPAKPQITNTNPIPAKRLGRFQYCFHALRLPRFEFQNYMLFDTKNDARLFKVHLRFI